MGLKKNNSIITSNNIADTRNGDPTLKLSQPPKVNPALTQPASHQTWLGPLPRALQAAAAPPPPPPAAAAAPSSSPPPTRSRIALPPGGVCVRELRRPPPRYCPSPPLSTGTVWQRGRSPASPELCFRSAGGLTLFHLPLRKAGIAWRHRLLGYAIRGGGCWL